MKLDGVIIAQVTKSKLSANNGYPCRVGDDRAIKQGFGGKWKDNCCQGKKGEDDCHPLRYSNQRLFLSHVSSLHNIV